MKRLLMCLLLLFLPSLMKAQVPIETLNSDTLRVNFIYKGTGTPTPADSNKVPTGYGTWYDTKAIRPLEFGIGLDSSAIAVGRIRVMNPGHNEIIDTMGVTFNGTSADFSFNIYCGTTIGTATDSLCTANWNVTGTNTTVTKVTADLRNSGGLGYLKWWFKPTAIATKPLDVQIWTKGH